MVPEDINSDSLNYLRSILVKSLSSENVRKSDVLKVKLYKYKKVAFNAKNVVDKEQRLKSIKDRQNEERQKKLEEIKAQAFAAQRFKEQKEMERRKRLEDLKGKEDQRRQQVEERKKAIVQAEQDRLVSILKRNQEREARIEAKKRNEKSNIVFAFGSSTPRMLDPTDATPSFFGYRRATSIQNITFVSSGTNLTRRQSERDLDGGSKKRATSAGGLERSAESSTPMAPAGCASGYVGRRRTDLMPTIPSRDSPFASSRKSLNHSPGRAYSMSRLDQLSKPRKRPDLPAVTESSLSLKPLSFRQSSVTRSMSHLAVSKTGLQSPKKTLNKADSRSMHQLSTDGPAIMPRTTRAQQLRQQKLLATSNSSDASSRPSSSLSQQSTTSVTSSVSVRHRPSTTPRRPRPVSIAITGISHDANKNLDKKIDAKPPLPKTRKSISKDKPSKSKTSPVDSTPKSLASPVSSNDSKIPSDTFISLTPVNREETPAKDKNHAITATPNPSLETSVIKQEVSKPIEESDQTECLINVTNTDIKQITSELIKNESSSQPSLVSEAPQENKENEMTTSVTKSRITTEEEAKAALAERRRLAREKAERQAEVERLRIEKEAQEEIERQRREEEQVQRLIEAQRIAEQERLEEAIKEKQRQEEEEKLRREEEHRTRTLKEEADKKAREEAERKCEEHQERLKNEEKEREVRRKRVEDIMRRTRGVNNANAQSQQNSDDKNENKSENNKMNGTNKSVEQENGTKNGSVDIVDNIISDDTMKNANTMSLDTINSTDSINSNNTWQTTQHYDPLM